jgi:hypothetical protein
MIARWLSVLPLAILFQTHLRAEFEKAVGSFQLNTTTGNQVISTLTFRPKIVFFKWSEQTTTGTSSAHYSIGYGVAISSSSRAAIFLRQSDGSLNIDARHAENRCIAVVNGSGTVTESADLVSMNSNGFTINVANAATAVRVSFEAWGGTSLTNAALIRFTTPTTAGSSQVTGAGFAPDLAHFFTAGLTAAPPATATGGRLGFGFAASVTAQAGLGNSVLSGTNADRGAQSSSKAIYVPNTSGMYLEANVSSFDADGVTLNYTKVQTTGVHAWAVFVKGLQGSAGSLVQPASPQNQSVTLPFEPEAAFFSSYCHPSASGEQATAKLSLGFAVSATEESVNWAGANSGNNQAQQANLQDAAIACYTAGGGGTPILNSKAHFISNNPAGFTVNWSAADSTPRQVIFFAVAEANSDIIAPLLITMR